MEMYAYKYARKDTKNDVWFVFLSVFVCMCAKPHVIHTHTHTLCLHVLYTIKYFLLCFTSFFYLFFNLEQKRERERMKLTPNFVFFFADFLLFCYYNTLDSRLYDIRIVDRILRIFRSNWLTFRVGMYGENIL